MNIQIISPDGFPIDSEIYPNIAAALIGFGYWRNRYKNQGYYSSRDFGRIELVDLIDFCAFVDNELKEIDSDTEGIEKLFVEMSAQQVYDKYIKPLRDNPDYKLPETGAMLFYTKKHSEGYDIDKIILTSLDEDYCISLIESVMDLEDFAGWPFGR